MSRYKLIDLTEFPEIPDKKPFVVTFKNCNFQKLNLESYNIGTCYFENCQIVEPLIINCNYLIIKNSNIKLSEHIKVDNLWIQCPEYTFDSKIEVISFIISDSIIKGIHNIDYKECRIYIENINENLLNMIINEDLFKDKHTHYDLCVSSRYKDKMYNFIYSYLDYNITGDCGLVCFDTLRNSFKKIKLIKAVEALQKKLKNGIY